MTHIYNYVYLITNILNNKKYIGKHSTDNLEDNYIGSGIIIKQIIHKYGKEVFKKQILEFCNSEEQAFEREKYWIKFYNALQDDNFYNLDQGGRGRSNYIPSQETRKKISQSQKERFKNKENHPMFNKHHSNETKEKIRQGNLGKIVTKQTKEKLSKAKSGENNPRAIKVECLNNHKIFNTIKEAAQWAGVDNSTLAQHLKGRTKTCGFDPERPFLKIRLKWKYIENE